MISTLMNAPINYWAILVGGVVAMVIGMIWYGPATFGKLWMKWSGNEQGTMSSSGVGVLYLLQFIAALVMTWVLAHFVVYFNVTDFSGALSLGFWLWLGFLAFGSAGIYLFPPKRWELFLFDNAYKLVNVVAIAWVLAVWR